jgi:hypothetical protein
MHSTFFFHKGVAIFNVVSVTIVIVMPHTSFGTRCVRLSIDLSFGKDDYLSLNFRFGLSFFRDMANNIIYIYIYIYIYIDWVDPKF